ncbi:hypothetical protein LCGC14_1773770 [marine sediment metagenome]|uniref:Leucine rich repeat variant n=1 Tax=marine sediment metagenome TaxID=412755 RepID=A0A0F9JX59_9ZZZZ
MTDKEIEIQLALGSLPVEQRRKLALAENSRTSEKILTMLSTDKDINVRCLVADNPNTSQEVLLNLSRDKDVPVRYAVLMNGKTSADTCAMIRDFDECAVIVYAAAKQCNLTLYDYSN